MYAHDVHTMCVLHIRICTVRSASRYVYRVSHISVSRMLFLFPALFGLVVVVMRPNGARFFFCFVVENGISYLRNIGSSSFLYRFGCVCIFLMCTVNPEKRLFPFGTSKQVPPLRLLHSAVAEINSSGRDRRIHFCIQIVYTSAM